MKSYILKSLILGMFLCSLVSCLSSDQGMKLDAEELNEPVVEAYIEYPGPDAKWAGPSNFMVHVNATEAGQAQVKWTQGTEEKANPESGLTQAEAREELKRLEIAVNESLPEYHGCLSPVRLRLIQANGTIVQRQACRGQTGWTKTVADTTHEFIDRTYVHKKAPLAAKKLSALQERAIARAAAEGDDD